MEKGDGFEFSSSSSSWCNQEATEEEQERQKPDLGRKRRRVPTRLSFPLLPPTILPYAQNAYSSLMIATIEAFWESE